MPQSYWPLAAAQLDLHCLELRERQAVKETEEEGLHVVEEYNFKSERNTESIQECLSKTNWLIQSS